MINYKWFTINNIQIYEFFFPNYTVTSLRQNIIKKYYNIVKNIVMLNGYITWSHRPTNLINKKLEKRKMEKRGVNKYASHRGHKTVVLCFSNFYDKDNAFPLYLMSSWTVMVEWGPHFQPKKKGADYCQTRQSWKFGLFLVGFKSESWEACFTPFKKRKEKKEKQKLNFLIHIHKPFLFRFCFSQKQKTFNNEPSKSKEIGKNRVKQKLLKMNETYPLEVKDGFFPQYRDHNEVEGEEDHTSPIFLFSYVATYNCFPQNLLSPQSCIVAKLWKRDLGFVMAYREKLFLFHWLNHQLLKVLLDAAVIE